MKRVLIVGLALAALVALPAAGWAQAKTDFAGTWTLDETKSDPAPARRGGGGGGGGRGGGRGGGIASSMTIKQTPAQLSIDRTTPGGTQTAVYRLDGSESANTMGMGEAKTKSSWDGAKLVMMTTQTGPGRGGETMTFEIKEVYSLDGGVLTIERTQTTPAGTQTRKLVYTKGM